MNICILGAGAMGSLFGGMLAQAGETVTLVDVNDAHIAAVQQQGLRLDTDAGSRHVRNLTASRPETASCRPDLLVVFTKTLHTAAALQRISHLIGPQTFVLTLQNGLGNLEAAAKLVSPHRVLIGMTTWPADYLGPGHVSAHGQGAIRLMAAGGDAPPALRMTADALNRAGLNCTVDPEVWKAVWEKVAFNSALNSICAVTGCTVDQIALRPEGLALVHAVIDEVIAVARAEGVQADAVHCRETVAHALANHGGHRPSMLQDVQAGRPTEIGSINGEVVARGQKHGVNTPHNHALLGLVRLMEAKPRATAPESTSASA